MINEKKDKKTNFMLSKKKFPLLLIIATLFIGIGYASVNSRIFDIKVKLKNHEDSIDNLSYEIQELQSGIEKSDEFLSDLWDRFDVTVDKLLDVRVENILRERDALEAKYRELLQKHNDLADAYDEYKNKHPEYITVTEIPVAKHDDLVTTCELNVEDDDFVDISDGKDEEA